jgi:hypothetical protein
MGMSILPKSSPFGLSASGTREKAAQRMERAGRYSRRKHVSSVVRLFLKVQAAQSLRGKCHASWPNWTCLRGRTPPDDAAPLVLQPPLDSVRERWTGKALDQPEREVQS